MSLINPSPVVVARRATTRDRGVRGAGSALGVQGARAGQESDEEDEGGAGRLFVLADVEGEPPEAEAMQVDGGASYERDDCGRENVDALEIFEHIRDIRDPEHPYSLEQLSVVGEEKISVDDPCGRISVSFTPTVQHCSMATLIGLSLRVKLMRVLHPRFKVDIRVSPGSHASEAAVNKQLNDKERVCAALENPNLINMVNKCIDATDDEL